MSRPFFWNVFWFRYLGIIVGLTLSRGLVSAQTTRIWNGSGNPDWFNATNWIPSGVPAANDIIYVTNGGLINLTAPVTISNQLIWSSGGFYSNALTVASNAVMIINTATTLALQNSLTNAGTVVWSNNLGNLVVENNGTGYFGLIANQPGALWDIQCDELLYNNAGTTANFYNSGALRKSATTGTTYFQIPLINSGSVTDLQGTLNFQGGGPISGTFAASGGATVDFSSGNFTNTLPVSMNGPGLIQLNGGNLWLLNNTISNLPLVSGTVDLGPAFQGGSITNLTISGATLAGTNTVTGTFNLNNGTIYTNGSLTISNNAVLNINGSGVASLECPLTNYGTVTWTNQGTLDVLNNNAYYFGLIENLPGALFDIQCDALLYNNAGTTAYFQNLGTLRKSAATSTTYFEIPLLNSGNVIGLNGTLDLYEGGTVSGTFTAALGATVNLFNGNFTNSGPVTVNGPGTVRLDGGDLFLLTDTITNFPLTSGMVFLGPVFQGGTITNLTFAGATLTGTNTVTGTFNLNGGTIYTNGSLTVASNAVLNINTSNTTILECPLTNFGTVNWTNSSTGGGLELFNVGGTPYSGLIENLSGALFDIQCDQILYNGSVGTPYFHNVGTLRKSASTGTTLVEIPLLNSGNVIGLNGTLEFYSGGILSGTFTAGTSNAIVSFAQGGFTNSSPALVNGPGTVELTGGTLTLLANSISNLLLAGGTVYLGPAFEQSGAITNLTISGATLFGTNTVTGTFNWNDGTISGGSITIASNALMSIIGTTTLHLQCPLTNFGTATWTNANDSGSLDVNNNGGANSGLIENTASGLFDIQCDGDMFNFAVGPAYFHNVGTLQKSAQTVTTYISIPVTNSGTVSSLSGEIFFTGGFTFAGGTMLFGLSSPTSYGTMNISGNAAIASLVGVLWLNGFVPANGNSFTLLDYGSHTGMFTNFTSPPGALWITNYGPTAFTATVSSINQLGFTTQPVGGILTNSILAPVVVQVEDPSSNAVPISGVAITLSLNTGSGAINGTLMQSTDSSGKATFSGLSFTAAGTKTLRAASSGLTSAISTPFQILSLIGLQWTNSGFDIQLNGSNNSSTVTIYATTNLGNPAAWLPIYTNPPTNGSINFLDTTATNYLRRFYRFTQP